MRRLELMLPFLIVCVLALTGFVLREDGLRGRDSSKSAIAVIFGDGRRLFANHFLTKADAYFHRGRYPSIFEMAENQPGNHLVETLGDEDGEAPHVHGPDCDHSAEAIHPEGPADGRAGEGEPADEHEHDASCAHAEPAGKPDDWIARLAARFEPDQHVHLDQGSEKEMLPWIQLAVEMDPHNVDAYTVGGYWLRQMGKAREAERFLREGQRNNPDSSEIYFELGRLYELEAKDSRLAANLYALSLEKWHQENDGLAEPNTLALAQILGRLGRVKENRGELDVALKYYIQLKTVSPTPDGVQRLIDSVRQRQVRQTNPPQFR
jgi:tetratricopeptide (TPR) repeat protein